MLSFVVTLLFVCSHNIEKNLVAEMKDELFPSIFSDFSSIRVHVNQSGARKIKT